jgi:GNAT superfamily N-acetyltransferase
MPAPVSIRPMEERDVAGVHAASIAAFRDVDERFGDPASPEPPLEQAAVRLRHLLATDPGGAWVADRGGAVAGCALALVRERVWGLSLLVVRPEEQSAGIGRELLARSHAYGDGARGRIVLSSRDVRALRSYVGLGLDLHPAARAAGTPRALAVAGGVRAFGPGDRAWVDAVGRAVRGAAHGGDLDAFAAAGATVSVLPDRGYAVSRGGSLKLLAARDEDAARTLLRTHLAAAAGTEATVEWLTAHQQWAMRECLDAGLDLDSAGGAVLTAGELGPMVPYLPSGAYL